MDRVSRRLDQARARSNDLRDQAPRRGILTIRSFPPYLHLNLRDFPNSAKQKFRLIPPSNAKRSKRNFLDQVRREILTTFPFTIKRVAYI